MGFGFPIVVLVKEDRFVRDALALLQQARESRNRTLHAAVD
jgi:hypothetical protein